MRYRTAEASSRTHQVTAPPTRPGSMRASLTGGVSALALACILFPAGAAWAQCTGSTQTISTATSDTVNSNGGAIEVTGSGNISVAGNNGIAAIACDATSITVDGGGLVTASGATGVVVGFIATVNALSNNGTISGISAIVNF